MKALFFVFLTMLPFAAQACPFCKTDTAKEIRASLFGPDLFPNLVFSVLPFLICSVIVYLIYHGGLPSKKKMKSIKD